MSQGGMSMSIVELGIWLTTYLTVPIVLIVAGFLLGIAWERNKQQSQADVTVKHHGRVFSDDEIDEIAARWVQLQRTRSQK